MSKGKVLHASQGGIHVFQFIGEIRYPLAPTVEHFFDSLFAAELPTGFVMDLTAATMIDSTNLGLLARLARRVEPKRVTLVSNRDDINLVLESMGFDQVFQVVPNSEPLTAEREELPVAEADRRTLCGTMLKAHRTLMALNERNRVEFEEVVSVLEQHSEEERSGA